jgi:hypothetical protein
MSGCDSRTPTYPCSQCGRLHNWDGSGAMNRRGEKFFIIIIIKGRLAVGFSQKKLIYL